MSDEKLIYDAALQKWGAEAQIKQAVEECAELIIALHHNSRGKASIEDVASEIADVEIMMGQLRILVGDNLVSAEKERKLERLQGVINEK